MTLKRQIDQCVRRFKSADPALTRGAAKALIGIGDTAAAPHLVDVIIEAARERDYNVLALCAEALRRLGGTEGVSMLVRVVDDKTVPMTSYKQAINANLNYYNDEDAVARGYAAEALGLIGDSAALPALVKALKDVYGDVRENAARALGRIGDEAALPALVDAMLQDTSDDVCQEAARALDKMDRLATVDAFSQALWHGAFMYDDGAVDALRKTAQRHGDQTAIAALIAALGGYNKWLRRRAACALEQVGEAAIPQLIEAVRHEEQWVRWMAPGRLARLDRNAATAALTDAMGDANYEVRRDAAESLAAFPDEAAVPALLEALADEDFEVRALARKALRAIDADTG